LAAAAAGTLKARSFLIDGEALPSAMAGVAFGRILPPATASRPATYRPD
jgi:hypothetical protein